jgi:hypothetical protein
MSGFQIEYRATMQPLPSQEHVEIHRQQYKYTYSVHDLKSHSNASATLGHISSSPTNEIAEKTPQ